MPQDLTVLSITGYTRSGSTLLDTLLGTVPGFFSAGELHYLWERGLVQGRRCGCGRPVPACPVWTGVLREAFPDGVPSARTVMDLQRRCARTRWTPRLLAAARSARRWPALQAYVGVAGAVYRGIARATGATVVVDSSKRPSDAAITRLIPGVDAYVVQLVRDPRAVVHSWARAKPELDRGPGGDMPRQSLASTAFGWAELNAMSELVRRRMGRRALLLRYEDLAADPRGAIEGILRLVGRDVTDAPSLQDGRFEMGTNHTVSGNPGRFSSGSLAVRPDEAWRGSLPPRSRAAATAMTLPLLLRYGYPVRAAAPRRA